MIFPRLLISMFTTNQEMIDLGGSAMRIIVLFVPAIGLQMIGPAFFMAIGKPVPAFFLSLSRQIIFLIPLVMVLPNLFGLSGLWVSFPIADGLSSAFTALLLSLELRRLKRRESRTTHDA